MDSIKIDNEIIIEPGRYKPSKAIFEGDVRSITELESAYEKLTDRVKAAISEKPIFIRWNKRTGAYEVLEKQDWFKNSDE